MLENFKNLYEVRKTVRFNLEAIGNKKEIKTKEIKYQEINNFIKNYDNLLGYYKNIMFKNGELNKKLKIKFSFFKLNFKKLYYDYKIASLKEKSKDNQIILEKIEGYESLFENFYEVYTRQSNILKIFSEYLNRGEHERIRNSEISMLIYNLKKRNNFYLILSLFDGNIKSENNYISDKINEALVLCKNILSDIESIEKELLPKKSLGLVVENASFNYFTINKNPIDYDLAEKSIENNLEKELGEFKLNINDKGFIEEYIGEGKLFEKQNIAPINEVYKLMKKYKSLQKIGFYEIIKRKDYNFLKNNEKISITTNKGKENEEEFEISIKLFNDINEEKFNNIKYFTEIIEDLSNLKNYLKQEKIKLFFELLESTIENIKINQSKYKLEINKELEELEESEELENLKDFEKIIDKQIVIIKKKRGEYFNENNKDLFAFNKYKIFCNDYKKIAIELGKIKASINSLKKERINSSNIKSWALILENKEKNQKFLMTIPRNFKNNNLKESKSFIEKLEEIEISEEKNINKKIYILESLTMKAFEKLCFGKEFIENKGDFDEKNGSFRKSIDFEMKKEIKEYDDFFLEKGKNSNKYKVLKQKYDFKKENTNEYDELLLIDFYKNVLKLKSTNEQIIVKSFEDYNNFIKNNYNNLNEFEENLKKTFYKKLVYKINDKQIEKLQNNFGGNLYKISSYDLEKNDYDEIKKLKRKDSFSRGNPEYHTKIWLDFWTEKNRKEKYPIRINPEISISFIEQDKDFFEKNKSKIFKNRRFKSKFLLNTTITEFATDKHLSLSYKKEDELKIFYNDYNKNFSENFSGKYIYGIDRGENELVSIGIFKNCKKLEATKIEILEIKSEYLNKNNNIYKNISYYIEDERIFEKKIVSCINLSMAKLIKGRIVLNGDISTYINLKIKASKRKIYNLISKSGFINKSNISIKYDKIYFKGDEIYKHTKDINNIYTIDEIKNILINYIEGVENNINYEYEEISIEKINNIRDSICGNMVGIINFLQEKFKGYIYLEDKNITDVNNRFFKNGYELGTRFEQKLFQNLSNKNLIPTNYKQFLSIKDNKGKSIGIKQIGIIGYISEKNTSEACPVCNGEFIKDIKKENLEVIENENINKLFGHGKGEEFEKSMHHYSEDNEVDYKNNLDQAKKTRNDNCKYHMENNQYGFDFIKSGDDLATYNIAKKAKEYLEKKPKNSQ